MESDPKAGKFRRSMIATLAWSIAALLVYAIAYFAVLEGKVYHTAGIDAKTGFNRYRVEPNFRCFGPQAELVFKPALWLDRRVRNEYWDTIENKLARTKWRNP